MIVYINYDKDEGEYNLICEELDIGFVSPDLFRVFVMFDEYLRTNGINISILESDSIEYFMDSVTMQKMILSNVSLLKLLKNSQRGFQASRNKFGSSPLQTSLGSISGNKSNKFSDIINSNKPKGYKQWMKKKL